MEIVLKRKYRTYAGDREGATRYIPQYGFGRKGNGNGKRPTPFRGPSNRVQGVNPEAKTMFVDGLTGHKVMG